MIAELIKLAREVEKCKKCPLHKYRTKPVVGEGDEQASIMLIGEAPGKNEDKEGRPFVGAAGIYLTNILREIGVDRVETYMTNAVKCRPPNNRKPTKKELDACRPYLLKQIEIIKPKVLICLGKCAAYSVLGREVEIKKEAGTLLNCNGTHVMLTYHPAFVMRFRGEYENNFIEHMRHAVLSKYFKKLDGMKKHA